MVLALNPGPQFAAITGNPAGLLFSRIWYSVGKSGVLGITEYHQGRPLWRNNNGEENGIICFDILPPRIWHRPYSIVCRHAIRSVMDAQNGWESFLTTDKRGSKLDMLNYSSTNTLARGLVLSRKTRLRLTNHR